MKRKIILIFNWRSIFTFFLIFILIYISISKEFKLNLIKKRKFYFNKHININDSFNKAKYFLDKCLRGILIKNKTIISSKNPIASVIIPIFNSENTIQRAIISIQNQDIENIEIILVNDYSSDNTSLVIKDLQKNDVRIKIMNNKINKGTLYSRCIGVLSAVGGYIFHLDSDDMFLDKDIFSTMINITFIGNFDFVSFKAISTYSSKNILNNTIKEHKMANSNSNRILFQPELGLYPIKPAKKLGYYKVNDNFLWNKCIKTSVYRKVLDKITEKRYSRYMVYEEDRLIVYLLFNVADSMKYLEKYGILSITRKGSITKRRHKKSKKYFISILYFVDIIIDLSKNSTNNRKILVYLMTYLLTLLKFNNFRSYKKYDKKLLISCLYRIISDKHVSNLDKEKLIEWVLSSPFKK